MTAEASRSPAFSASPDFVVLPLPSAPDLEIQLARQVAYFGTLFDSLPDGVAILDMRGRVVNANRSFESLFQYRLDELRGKFIDTGIVPLDLHAEAQSLSRRIFAGQTLQIETTRRRKDGRLVPVRVHAVPIMVGIEQAGAYAIYIDISERQQLQRAVQRHRQLARTTLAAIGDGVIRTDIAGCVRDINPVAERLTGWSKADAVGQPIDKVFVVIDEASGALRPHPLTRLNPTASPPSDTLLIARDGRETAIADSVSPISEPGGRPSGLVIVVRDLTAARSAERQMVYQASHDALTGLVNRAEFERRLASALRQADSGDTEHSMLYLDLDQFRVVNDICGHQAGDELLRRLTTLLARDLRDTDTLARLGGDEFGVLLLNCAVAHAERLAHKFIRVIEEFRFDWRGRTFSVAASIGVVAVNRDCESLSDLFAAADSACYSAKEKGPNRVRVYQSDDQDLARRHDEMGWVSRINQALEDNRFLLYHQAISPLHARERLRRSEILLRLRDERGDIIAPASFIPAAERYHLMPALDRWVIRNAFAGLRRQLTASNFSDREAIAINISGATIGEECFAQFVQQAFREFQVPPALVCFEITETAAIANLAEASAFIDRIRALGCSISLDDFGSGLSSFAYLKTLHVDYLKIDGVFVRNMAEDPIDCAMVDTINRVGKIMGVKTVAEYVEQRGVLDKLRELDVDFAQGYDIHVPEPWRWGAS